MLPQSLRDSSLGEGADSLGPLTHFLNFFHVEHFIITSVKSSTAGKTTAVVTKKKKFFTK